MKTEILNGAPSRSDNAVGASRQNRYGWLLLAAGFAVTAAVSLQMKSGVDRSVMLELTAQCDEIKAKISDRLEDHTRLLRSGAAFFDASGVVTREQWRVFARNQKLEQELPGIQGLGFSILIPREEFVRHLRELQREGFPTYAVRPAGDRELYSSIIYLEPFSGSNLRAFGYDMFSEPVRRAAMEQARDTGAAALSGKVVLLQEDGAGVQGGTLIYFPVYRQGAPHETVTQRRASLLGWVYSPHRMSDLMLGTVGRSGEDKKRLIHFQLFDGIEQTPQTLLYETLSDADKKNSHKELLTGRIQANGRTWTIRFTGVGGKLFSAAYQGVWLTMAGGAAVTLLLFFLIRSLLSTRSQALLLARAMTHELRESEEKVNMVLNTIGEGVYGIDLNGCCTFCNPAALRILRYRTQEELLGKNMHRMIHHSYRDGSVYSEESCPISRTFRENSECYIENEVLWRAAGVSFPAEYWSVPQQRDGKIVGAVVTFQDITQRKLLETKIQGAREYAENIVETVREPLVVLDSDLLVLTANRSFFATFKVTPEETIGNFICDLGDGQWDIPKLRTLFESILPDEAVFNGYEVEHDFPGIGKKTMLLNARQIFRKDVGSRIILLAMEDITARIVAEKKLIRSQEEWRATFDTLPDLVAILGLDHRIIRVNRAMAAALKVEAGDAVGLTCFQHVHGADCAPDDCPHSMVLADGREHRAEIHEERLGGWFQVSATPIHDEEGELMGSVHVVHDITTLKKNEKELLAGSAALQEQAQLLRQEVEERRYAQKLLTNQQLLLETLNGELEQRVADGVKEGRAKDLALIHNEKMVSLGQLAAGVAHEINNPMGYITSNLHELADYFQQIVASGRIGVENGGSNPGPSTGESREMTLELEYLLEDGVDLIRESLEGAGKVSKIVQELKAFSRNDAPECETVTLASCLESALTVAGNELKYVAVVRKEYESREEVFCHPGQLSQVFLNLLVNAGHAIVSETMGEIVLRSWHDELFVYASVSDTGGGIPEELRERIFDPFFTTKGVGKGTGLGLSISSDIMKKHGGELFLESIVGSGTTFTVKLPCVPEEVDTV